jgi:hypothetical protein
MPTPPRSARVRCAAPVATALGALLAVFATLATGGIDAAEARETSPGKATLSASLSTTEAALGSPVTVSGTSTPAVSGVELTLQRYSDSAWLDVDTMTTSVTGAYATTFRRPVAGSFRYRVVKPADARTGSLVTALPALEIYRLHTYSVRIRGHIVTSLPAFEARVAATYADPRGWVRAHRRFQQVASGGDFTVVLAEAKYLPTYSSTCSVKYSCRVGSNVIMNQDRWRLGSSVFPGTITQYRQMVTNHETGHWIGSHHLYCGPAGGPAPVMQQQSKGMQGCTPNAWPLRAEIAAFS